MRWVQISLYFVWDKRFLRIEGNILRGGEYIRLIEVKNIGAGSIIRIVSVPTFGTEMCRTLVCNAGVENKWIK